MERHYVKYATEVFQFTKEINMKFRMAKDSWTSKETSMIPKFLRGHFTDSDKVQHALGGLVLALILGIWTSPIIAGALSALFWKLWEVKDAYVPWETVGFWGGDGFSWRDMLASWGGALAGALFLAL